VITLLNNGVTNGNPLETWMEHVGNKWKNRNQSFLVGSEILCNFVTHLNNCNSMFSIHSNHIVINEIQYLRIVGHIQSSNSFFNCKTLHMIVVNKVYINCDKLLRETTCLSILLYKYWFCTILKLLYNVHKLHLVATSTSPYYYDLLFPLLLISPILIPRCQLTRFLNPKGSSFKIASNTRRFIYFVKHCDHVRRYCS
jgi:hypothetical protein